MNKKPSVNVKPWVLIALAAAGCGRAGAEEARPIDAFLEICVSKAPTFADSAATAASFGIADLIDASGSKVGMSDDNSLGVQIKPGVECVITTPKQANPQLTEELLAAIAPFAGGAVKRLPAKIQIGGKAIFVLHDRIDGEAFIARVAGK